MEKLTRRIKNFTLKAKGVSRALGFVIYTTLQALKYLAALLLLIILLQMTAKASEITPPPSEAEPTLDVGMTIFDLTDGHELNHDSFVIQPGHVYQFIIKVERNQANSPAYISVNLPEEICFGEEVDASAIVSSTLDALIASDHCKISYREPNDTSETPKTPTETNRSVKLSFVEDSGRFTRTFGSGETYIQKVEFYNEERILSVYSGFEIDSESNLGVNLDWQNPRVITFLIDTEEIATESISEAKTTKFISGASGFIIGMVLGIVILILVAVFYQKTGLSVIMAEFLLKIRNRHQKPDYEEDTDEKDESEDDQ